MRIGKTWLCLITTMLLICNTKAQIAQMSSSDGAANSIANPNAGKSGSNGMGDLYSPDLSTGTVGINIPIYSYSVDGVNIGVSLGYNTRGIKVDEIAPWTGLGWDLSIGGNITRIVHGVEDERTYEEIDTTSLISSNLAKAMDPLYGYWVNTATVNGKAEEEPDEFSASFGGQSITFQIKNTGSVMVTPNSSIQVEVSYGPFWFSNTSLVTPSTGSVEQNIYIKITDMLGNQFFFQPGDVVWKGPEYKAFHPVTVSSGGFHHYVNSWTLSKIVTYAGNIITYNYDNTTETYAYSRDQRVRESSIFSFYDGHIEPGKVETINSVIDYTHDIKRIKSIVFPNGDIVKFNQDTHGREDIVGYALKSITVENGYDAIVRNMKTFRMKYGYFKSDGPDAPYPFSGTTSALKVRLKLAGIDQVGTDGTTTLPYYNFDYNTTKLPERYSGQTDFYGFYNGIAIPAASISPNDDGTLSDYANVLDDLSKMSIPAHSFTFISNSGSKTITYGKDMTPNWQFAQANLLNKITNALGASVSFSYTKHNLSLPVDFYGSNNGFYYYQQDEALENGTLSGLSAPVYLGPPNIDGATTPTGVVMDGVCIKKIINRDGVNNANTTVQEFVFTEGSMLYAGGYFWNTELFATAASTPIDNNTSVIRIYQNSFVTPMDLFKGNNHCYTGLTINNFNNTELLSVTKYKLTGLYYTAGEKINGFSPATYISKLQLRYGKYSHTFNRVFFYKEFLGLLKEKTEYDQHYNLLSGEANEYNLRTFTNANDYLHYDERYSYTHTDPTSYVNPWALPSGSVDNTVNYFRYNVVLDKSTKTAYAGVNSMSTDYNYLYQGNTSYNNLASISWKNSKGQNVVESYLYDYTTIQESVGATTVGLKNTFYLLGKETQVNGTTVNYSRMQPIVPSSVSSKNFNQFGDEGGGLTVQSIDLYRRKIGSVVGFANNSTHHVLLETRTVFDTRSNIVEYKNEITGKYNASIWDNRIGKKVAEAGNSRYGEFAYTSFEGAYTPYGTDDDNKGNWDFDPANIQVGGTWTDCMTGRYYLKYSISSSNILSKIIPTTQKVFLLSFWYQGVRPVARLGTTIIPLTDQSTVGGWTLATGSFTGNGTDKVKVKANGIGKLDELRLHPADAVVNSYTYEPLVGVSSNCDARNKITYFEYDAMGRPIITRDIDRNIIQLQKTVVQGNDN